MHEENHIEKKLKEVNERNDRAREFGEVVTRSICDDTPEPEPISDNKVEESRIEMKDIQVR